MKASLNFIKDFVDIDCDLETLEKIISFHVIEIEGISQFVKASSLTTGEVIECENHPDSDHLHVCKVDLGDSIEQIVCGAPNCQKGIKVIVAKVGAILPGDFKIKASKIRGVESKGMICSLQELGIPEAFVPDKFKDGIFIFENDIKVGENPLKALGFDDTIIELGLTPNRADLLSHLGIAYDVAAAMNKKVSYPKIKMENTLKSSLSVKIDTQDCQAYYARKVTNVTIKESPWWLKSRLMACGIRPINNVVDITNYVMLELGQPLHAFDAKKLGSSIVVRNAKENEKIITLDEIQRDLKENDILITDGKKGVALAGVMGGLNSSISSSTKEIVLESAIFNPTSVRKTSSRLGLRSESSMRFERKVDPNRMLLALDRATQLLGELAGADIKENYTCADKTDKKDKIINITCDKVNSYLGTALSQKEIADIFSRLGFENIDAKTIGVPTRRVDIENTQDLMEEIARIYGFDNIKSTLPVTNSKGSLNKKQQRIRSIRHALAGLGFNETINYSLINKKEEKVFGNFENSIDLLMPMTEDRETLRQSLLNSMVEALRYNKARQISDLAIFEIGKVYNKKEEKLMLSCAMMGKFQTNLWQGKKVEADFYLIKGVCDHLMSLLGMDVSYQKELNSGLHDGISAGIYVKNQRIGEIGALHPSLIKANDLDKAFVMEINLDALLNMEETKFSFISTPKYPSVTRDIAIVIKKDIVAASILDMVKQTARKYLVDVNIFDVYEGEKIDQDLKSIAISMTFRDNDKTMTSEDVDKVVNSVLKRLDFTYQAKLRS